MSIEDRKRLVQLSIIHQELQEKYESQKKLLAEVSQKLLKEMQKDVSVSEEQKTMEWVKDMYDYRPRYGYRNRLASKTRPKTTSNTKKNRFWIEKTVELCIELGIMYRSKEGTLWSRVSRGEALLILEEYFDRKRREVIDVKKD